MKFLEERPNNVFVMDFSKEEIELFVKDSIKRMIDTKVEECGDIKDLVEEEGSGIEVTLHLTEEQMHVLVNEGVNRALKNSIEEQKRK